ncbi:MAG: MBL fold metallo-hydrolase [Woeseia sp.]
MRIVLLWLKRIGIGLAGGIFVSVPATMLLWQNRDSIWEMDLAIAEAVNVGPATVTVTWLGVTTLLFDDGETQILIDGFFSRPDILDILFRRPVASDAANINYVLDEFQMRRLAAVIPVHSHYAHAMDVGAIANRTSASVVGTESTANIARGADVPEDQIMLVANGDSLTFGKFTVNFMTSRHVPDGFGDSHLLAGFMSEPVRQPAVFTEWREGGSWSILIGHPEGTTLVHGSAGFVEDALSEIEADVAMLSVAGLYRQGLQYTREYWQQTVGRTGAKRVFVIHHDDFTEQFGRIRLMSKAFDNVGKSVNWLNEFAGAGEQHIELLMPTFGVPVSLY